MQLCGQNTQIWDWAEQFYGRFSQICDFKIPWISANANFQFGGVLKFGCS